MKPCEAIWWTKIILFLLCFLSFVFFSSSGNRFRLTAPHSIIGCHFQSFFTLHFDSFLLFYALLLFIWERASVLKFSNCLIEAYSCYFTSNSKEFITQIKYSQVALILSPVAIGIRKPYKCCTFATFLELNFPLTCFFLSLLTWFSLAHRFYYKVITVLFLKIFFLQQITWVSIFIDALNIIRKMYDWYTSDSWVHNI